MQCILPLWQKCDFLDLLPKLRRKIDNLINNPYNYYDLIDCLHRHLILRIIHYTEATL